VIQGSNGEAAHLTHHERSLTVRTIRDALIHEGYPDLPLIVGTGAPSVRETVMLCKQVRCYSPLQANLKKAHSDGGNFVIVLPPSYFMTLMTEEALLDFFRSVCMFVYTFLTRTGR
jgi:4-hydroxy-2-oxoglutarate aldolase